MQAKRDRSADSAGRNESRPLAAGGCGGAKNLCNHATEAQGDPSKLKVDADLAASLAAFHAAKKPIGLCCIAPVLAAAQLKCEVTVGMPSGAEWPYGDTVGAIEAYGGSHVATGIDGVHIDAANKVITAPAYMFEGRPHEIFDSVGLMVEEVVKRA